MPGRKAHSKQTRTPHDPPPVSDMPIESIPDGKASYPIVGLGASAGGLEALKLFFAKVPQNSGLAYIVVVHMTPKQPSILAELLQKVSRIPIKTAVDGEPVQPDHAYVAPPDKEINLYQGALQLLDFLKKRDHLSIDFFFRSLARDQGANACGIVLSGTGTDGTLGLKEIKEFDGLTLVQSEKTAAYDGMPRSAIQSGIIDMVLPPEEMPERLIRYYEHHPLTVADDPVKKSGFREDTHHQLPKIFALLRNHTGHDFSVYKKNTILRRIVRRMNLNNIREQDQYIRFLREHPQEVETLFRELLIGVTHFFRDAPSFDVLQKDILPGLLDRLGDGETFRAWIPGCSTGEEVYSLAIILRECLDGFSKRITLQLFGTDIDQYAIEKARNGLFHTGIAADVSADRLNRFFIREGDSFRIRREIRDCVIFSVQDVIKDPPFSRLNLLCCRNLLIYLNASAQKRLVPLFHYTLRPEGVLVLGSSETIGGFTDLFENLNNKWKIFRAKEAPATLRGQVAFPTGPGVDTHAIAVNTDTVKAPDINLGNITKNLVLERFSPSAVLIDAKGNILHVQGRTGKYLEATSGPPTRNVLDMAREGLRIELSSAIRNAAALQREVTRGDLHVRTNGDTQIIHLHVIPLKQPPEVAGQLLVVFEDVAVEPESSDSAPTLSGSPPHKSKNRISELEKELQYTRESHQTTIEELESSNEELKSTNEEMQSANEELQSTNEELESSKEELQSLNEELHTVNSEMQNKVEELSAAQDDMRNLLNSIEIATLFVDNEKRIKRFTREAAKIINLIHTDIGRPIEHVVSNLAYDGMIRDLTRVLETLAPMETEVRTWEGNWYAMRIMPYRTTDNRIDGAVLTFTGIDDQKRAQEMLHTDNIDMETLLETVFDANPKPMIVLDSRRNAVIANAAFYGLMEKTPGDIKGRNLFTFENDLFSRTDLEKKITEGLEKNMEFTSTPFELDRHDKKRLFSIHGRPMRPKSGSTYCVILRFDEFI